MNTSEFQQKINQPDRPVVVDFWAPWCAPCRATKPILEALAREYKDKVDFLPVNADDSHEILQNHRVAGIPTVIAFRKGKIAGRVTGAQSEAGYRLMFEALATGGQVKVPLSPFDRFLRLGAGGVLIIIGLYTSNGLVTGIGGLVALLGIYDLLPFWPALSNLFKRK